MKRKNNFMKEVPVKKVNRNLFDLSHEVKLSMKFGFLYPILLCDAVPGDVMRDQMTAFLRAAPMLAPIMHRVDVTTHFFFVPNRLLWNNWEDFITGGQDGTLAPVVPTVNPEDLASGTGSVDVMTKGTLWDYLGLPAWLTQPASLNTEPVDAGPFKAYAKIWNDFYRDPNLDTELDIHEELDGDVSDELYVSILGNTAGSTGLRQRGWERDYFTGALPWAQRGAQVLMPLSGSATVEYSPATSIVGAAAITEGNATIGPLLSPTIKSLRDTVSSQNLQVQNIEDVIIDGATTTISDFRTALAIQSWLENNARGGGRYTEQIQSHFNVRVPDFRLQRAEYLGGGKQVFTISEVLATANSEVDTEVTSVGDMAGHGVSVGKSNRFSYQCQEHGWIMGIMSIMPQPAYQQGIPKMWSRNDKYDYAWPELAHLGEQQVLSKEIFYSYLDDDAEDNDDVFGYVPRYAEYKFMWDRVAGDFRDNLGYWHLTRIFKERPVLDSEFLRMIEDSPTIGNDREESFRRIFAVQDGTDYFWGQLFHKFSALRPLPYFGVPRLQG